MYKIISIHHDRFTPAQDHALVRDFLLSSSSDPTARSDEVPRDTGTAEGPRCRPYYRAHLRPDFGQQGTLRKKSRRGCYLGLRPRRSQSGERDPQLDITKAGNTATAAPHASGVDDTLH